MAYNMYTKRGFVVTAILVDPEFKHIKNFLNKSGGSIEYITPSSNSVEPSINVTAENEHVKEAERKIYTVKEGARLMQATLPIFRKIPQMLVILMVVAILF